MTKIMFVCHGNICRSPMAEFVMKDLVKKAGREEDFLIASAAVSTEEIGNGVFPPARRKLAEHGITCHGHAAHRITADEVEDFDLICYMDADNGRRLRRMFGENEKFVPLLGRDVADPWYTGDFQATWLDVLEGCTALLERF